MSSQAVSSSLESAGTCHTMVSMESFPIQCAACMCCAQSELGTVNHLPGGLPQSGACGMRTVECRAPHRLARPAIYVIKLEACTIFPYHGHALHQGAGLGSPPHTVESYSAPGVNARPLTGL